MATGLRKIIYIPNEEIWQGIQASAKRANRSVSNFLVTLYQDSVRVGDTKQSVQSESVFFNPQLKSKK